jgi:hypothetical protein
MCPVLQQVFLVFAVVVAFFVVSCTRGQKEALTQSRD